MRSIWRPGRARTHKNLRPARVIAVAGVALACSEAGPEAPVPSDPSGPPVQTVPEPPSAPPGCEVALDQSAPTRFYDAVRCIFDGTEPAQRGVTDGVIDPQRAAVLQGRVLNEEGEPLRNARVEVLGHGEYGWTETRESGQYDLVVNGGGQLTIRVGAEGYLRAQRHLSTRWRRFEAFPDIVLADPAEPSAPVTLAGITNPTLLRGPESQDNSGRRRHAVVVAPGQVVTARLPDGTEQPLSSMSLRATEFTVGERGPQAMPADLPETSAYTYALDLSLVEAEALGAKEVTFDPPLVNYVDNFLHFPAGTVVPVGVYDEERDVWEAEKSGLVIDIVGTENELALVDADGDGKAESTEVLDELGLTPQERRLLAQEYGQGASLWRVETAHFSTWDCNWPYGFPGDAIEAIANVLGFGPKDCKRRVGGSIIGCEDQTLGEVLPVAGTPYRLHYQSERMPGRRDRYALSVGLSGAELPPSLKRIELEIDVHGQTFKQTFEPTANLTHEWQWDGKDAYGRQWQGRAPADVKVGYVYDGAYESTDRFGQVGSGTPITGDQSRQEITSWASWTGMVGGFNHAGLGLGGWTLDVHHVLDREGGMLHLGNGQRRSAEAMGPTIRTVAGTGSSGFEGDGGPAVEARISRPHGLAIGPDGTVFFSDEDNNRVRRIRPDGTIDTYAGNGEPGAEGDGGPATQAALGSPLGIALAKDGTLYVTQRDDGRVRAIAPTGTIRTIAGRGEVGRPDGVPATDAAFKEPHAVAFSPDGSLYVVDTKDGRVYRIGPDGIIVRSAGNGSGSSEGDGGPALEATLDNPIGIAVDAAGRVYLSEYDGCRIRSIAPTGIISTVAGTGVCGFSGDGGPATLAMLDSPHDIQVGTDGSIYFSDEGNRRIRRIRLNGVIETVAGSGESDFGDVLGDGGSPLQAGFSSPRVVYAHHDGTIWIGDYSGDRIRRIDSPLPGFAAGESFVASSDARELHVFDTFGRHVRTLDALAGFTRLAFSYEGNGLLRSVKDGFGSETVVQRVGGQATSLVGPFGHETRLELDARGFLSKVTNPAGAVSALSYTDEGLLTRYQEPSAGEIHSFFYDEAGLLVRDESPSGYYQTLSRAALSDGFAVIRTHRGERPELHQVQSAGQDAEVRVLTDAAGISQTTEQTTSGTTRSGPWGSEAVVLSGDPRFGMQAPVTAQRTMSAPDGTVMTVTTQRNATLAQWDEPLSLETLEVETDVGNERWTRAWDASSRTWSERTPEYRTASTVLNEAGQVVSIQTGDLMPITYEYDARGRVSALHHGARSTTYAYGDDGFVSSVTNALGEVLIFERDALGEITRQQFGDGSEVVFAFDPSQRLTGITPPGKAAHQLNYSLGSLLSAYEPPLAEGASGLKFAYDPFDALASVADGTGGILTYSYEPSTGRLAEVKQPEETFVFSYDPVSGQFASVQGQEVTFSQEFSGLLPKSANWSGVVSGTIAWDYDETFQLAQESAVGHAVSFSYDGDRLLTAAGEIAFERDSETGLVTSGAIGDWYDRWSVSDYGEVVGRWGAFGSSTVLEMVDERDALGRLAVRTETVEEVSHELSFAYDARGRLSAVQRDGVVVESYTYDPNGNRVSATVAGIQSSAQYDAQDRLITYGSANYSRSAAGELVQKTEGSNVTSYHYDRRGSLRGVDLPDGRAIQYATDGLGRRVGKRIGGALVQGLLYRDGLSPVAELGPDGQTLVSRFIYGPNPHVPEYMVKDGKTYRFVSDQVGSIRLVVNVDDGTIAQRIDYTAFGEVLLDTNPGFQPFGFAAGLADLDTGLLRFGARDYDPHTGRWTAKDPILFGGGQTNLYVYVGNDPANRVDPRGLATNQVGIDVTLCVVGCIGVNPNYVTDGTNSGFNLSVSLGAASNFALSGGFAHEWTSADSISDLNGLEVWGGVSGGEGVSGGLEYARGINSSNGSLTYHGIQSTVGVGAGVLLADTRGGFTFGWNLFSTKWWDEHFGDESCE